MTTIKEICERYELTQTALARRFEIPLRTVQDWYAGRRTPPDYVVKMMEERLQPREIYLIFRDSIDDACYIEGYIEGTEEEADRYCDALNEGCRYGWEEFIWEVLKNLKQPEEQ